MKQQVIKSFNVTGDRKMDNTQNFEDIPSETKTCEKSNYSLFFVLLRDLSSNLAYELTDYYSYKMSACHLLKFLPDLSGVQYL